MFKKSIENKLKFNLIKSIIWGLAIPVFVMWIWFSVNGNPFDEYRLIKHGVKTTGKIYEVKEVENVDEKYNDRQVSINYEYFYKFTFNLPSGDTIYGSGKEGGYIPNEFENVEINPVSVSVEYFSENPNINRVSSMLKSNNTIYEWLRYNLLGGLILFIVSALFGAAIINNGLKEYRQGVKQLV